jgi:hypothetical protein
MSTRNNAIAEELLALRDNRGRISAPAAVRWARDNPGSHLHGTLMWANDVAAERYRVWQVRALISVHIVDKDGGRRFVSLSIDREDEHGGGYRSVSEVMADEDLRDVMIKDALADLERVRVRYEKLTELAAVWVEMHKVSAKRQRSARKIAEQPAAA